MHLLFANLYVLLPWGGVITVLTHRVITVSVPFYIIESTVGSKSRGAII